LFPNCIRFFSPLESGEGPANEIKGDQTREQSAFGDEETQNGLRSAVRPNF
jgi:hypothetical protein